MNDEIPRMDETDAEIELSAQELLALANARQVEPEPTTVPQPPRPAKDTSLRKLSSPLAMIVALGLIGATYALTRPEGAKQSTADTSSQITQSQTPAPQQFAQGEPVRFANPFDTDEVFEFPPGTTEAQARDAVADVLLKRAMSRQKT